MQGIKVPFKIKNLVISSILGLMVSLCLASFVFADDIVESSSNNVVSELLDQNYKNPEILNLAKSIKASTATSYDLDDIYNIIDECANALVEYDGSEFVSVTEYVHACLTGIASGLFNGSSQNPYLGTINSNIASIQAAVYGPAWDGSGVTNSLWNALQTLYSVNHADQLAQMAKQQGIIDALVGNTQYSLSNKLTSFNNDFNNIGFESITNSRVGAYNLTDNNSFIPTSTNSAFLNKRVSFVYDITPLYSYSANDYIIKVFIPTSNPLYNSDYYIGMNRSQDSTSYSTSFYVRPVIEPSRYGYYITFPVALYNFAGSGNVYMHVTLPQTSFYHYSSNFLNVLYVTSNSEDYYKLLNIYHINHIDTDIHNQSDILNRFKDLYASDDLIAAKSAQQGYEDQALDDFTGSGSAAAKASDLSSAKQISGSVKSGLNSGGSVNNGLSGFSTSGGLYAWFTQENYNLINNLYIPNQRNFKSYNDYDMSAYEDNYQYILDNLGDDQR